MKTLRVALGAFFLVFCPHIFARAEPSDATSAAAASHFEKGVEFYREGSLDAALMEFERAYELVPNYRLLFNLAQIQAERHDYTAALGFFEEYLQMGAAEVPAARRAEAEQEIEKLRDRIAYLWIESDVEGAQLFIDDAAVATLPLSEPLPVNPGVSNLRLEKAGYLPTHHALKVAGGERPRLRLTLVAATRGAAEDPAPKPLESASARYMPFWISSAATLAFGAATLATGLTAHAADRDLKNDLNRFPANQDQVGDARSRLKLYSGLTDGLAAASVVGLGLAIYFLVKPPKPSSHPQNEASRRSLHVSPGHRGMALHVTF